MDPGVLMGAGISLDLTDQCWSCRILVSVDRSSLQDCDLSRHVLQILLGYVWFVLHNLSLVKEVLIMIKIDHYLHHQTLLGNVHMA